MKRKNLSVPAWWRAKRPIALQRCYSTKTDALRAFSEANRDLIDAWGGESRRDVGGGEYDAINERFNLRGARKAGSIGEALWAALPAGKPYCLDRLDLDTLNETAPAASWRDQTGRGFRLPVEAEPERERSEPAPERRRGDRGPGFPLTGRRCREGEAGKLVACSAPGAVETDEVLYRPHVAGARPRVHLRESDEPVLLEDEARDARGSFRIEAAQRATRAEEFSSVDNPHTWAVERETMKRNAKGQFIKRARRARRNPPMETALLVNPARANVARRRRRKNPFAALALNPRRRRRNPGKLGDVGQAVGGALGFSVGVLVIKKMVGAKKLGKWESALKIGLGVLGYIVLRKTRFARVGDAMFTLGVGTVAMDLLGPMFEGKGEKKKGGKVKGLEAFNALLVERERQAGLGAEGDEMDDEDELGEDGDDDEDELGEDGDEDEDELGEDDDDEDELGAELVMRERAA